MCVKMLYTQLQIDFNVLRESFIIPLRLRNHIFWVIKSSLFFFWIYSYYCSVYRFIKRAFFFLLEKINYDAQTVNPPLRSRPSLQTKTELEERGLILVSFPERNRHNHNIKLAFQNKIIPRM